VPQGLPQEDGLVEMRERNRVLLQENARLLEAVDRLKRGTAAAQPPPVRALALRSSRICTPSEGRCADHHVDHAWVTRR